MPAQWSGPCQNESSKPPSIYTLFSEYSLYLHTVRYRVIAFHLREEKLLPGIFDDIYTANEDQTSSLIELESFHQHKQYMHTYTRTYIHTH